MTVDIVKAIFEVAKTLFGLKSEMEKGNREKRDRVSNYFSDLAKLIEEVSASLKLKKYPHGSCAQLETLAKLMTDTLKGLLKEDEINSNTEKLLEVYKIEQLFGEIHNLKPDKISKKLEELDKAAGYFRALAAHLKVVNE